MSWPSSWGPRARRLPESGLILAPKESGTRFLPAIPLLSSELNPVRGASGSPEPASHGSGRGGRTTHQAPGRTTQAQGGAGPWTLLLVLLCLAPGALSGQTILNTERFQLQEVHGAHMSADVSLSLKRGNSEVFDLSASGIMGVLRGKHWPRLIFGGQFLSDEDRSILDQQFAQLRYSYLLSDRLQTFHFVQAQKNETLLLRSRWLLGTGLRWVVHGSDRTELAIGTGLMGEAERFDRTRLDPADPWESEALRIANLGVFSHELEGGARILNIVYLQPDVAELSDTRVLNELGLFLPLSERLRTTVSLEWRRDPRPPGGLRRNDVNLKVGVGVEFH